MTVPEPEPGASATEPSSDTQEAPATPPEAESRRDAGTRLAALRRLPRRRLIVAAVAGVGVLILLAGIVVAVIFRTPEPEDVVADYLETLQAGEVSAALEYASHVPEFDEHSADLLTSEALSEDWEVEVVRRHDLDIDPATVDVDVVADDGTSRQGRFQLDPSDSGDGWTILNPLVKLSVAALPLQYAQFNAASSPDSVVWLFPGVYEPYPDLSDTLDFSASTYVAVPRTVDPGSEEQQLRETSFLPLLEVSEEFEAELHEQLRDWIDECAQTNDPEPDDCPFSTSVQGSRVQIQGDYYETDEVEWEPIEYPTVQLEQDEGKFSMHTVEPGEIRLSGEGRSLESDSVEEFEAVCRLDVEGVDSSGGFDAVYTAAGEFVFFNELGWFDSC